MPWRDGRRDHGWTPVHRPGELPGGAQRGGLLKIMSKMGICTVSAYRGSELFEVIGLDDEVARAGVPFYLLGGCPGAGFEPARG